MSRRIKVTFTGTEDFEAVCAAEAWCRARGISVGSMQRGEPRGLLYGRLLDRQVAGSQRARPKRTARNHAGTNYQIGGYAHLIDENVYLGTRANRYDDSDPLPRLRELAERVRGLG